MFGAVSDSPVRLRYQFPEHGETAFTLSISVVQGETPPPAGGRPKYTIIMTDRYRTVQTAAKEAALVEYVITRISSTSNEPSPEFYDTDMATIFGSFRLASVSADKKRALLEPIVSFDYPEMEFGGSTVSGWLVFSLDQGAILDMYVFIHLNVSQYSSDPGMNMAVDTKTVYSTSR